MSGSEKVLDHTAGGVHANGCLVFLPKRIGGFDLRGCPEPVALAERIAACMNYCAGVSNADLALMPLADLVAQLGELSAETARAQAAEHAAIEARTTALAQRDAIAALMEEVLMNSSETVRDSAEMLLRDIEPCKIVIEVSGGVAEVTTNTHGLDVTIIDHDNEEG